MQSRSSKNFGSASHPHRAKSIFCNILEGIHLNRAVNSLFPKILSITPCGSRFYRSIEEPCASKSFEINILQIVGEKKCGALPFDSRPKSLFRNILPLSHCRSRFYRSATPSPSSKILRINILENVAEKNRRTTISPQAVSRPCNIDRSTPPVAASRCTRRRCARRESIPDRAAAVRPSW